MPQNGTDHGGKAGLELVAVQKAVAISIKAVKHLLDGRGQLSQHKRGISTRHPRIA